MQKVVQKTDPKVSNLITSKTKRVQKTICFRLRLFTKEILGVETPEDFSADPLGLETRLFRALPGTPRWREGDEYSLKWRSTLKLNLYQRKFGRELPSYGQ